MIISRGVVDESMKMKSGFDIGQGIWEGPGLFVHGFSEILLGRDACFMVVFGF